MSRAGVLDAFDRALALETHHLSRDPALLPQQLGNRLQWEEDEVRALLDSQRHAAPTRRKAVIRLKTQHRESRALVRTLEAHRGPVHDCAIERDGEEIVSVGADGVARHWDRATGKEIRSVVVAPRGGGSYHEFQEGATCCAVSPDGSFVVCGGAQGTVKIWDSKTGNEISNVSESAYSVNSCVVLPDAKHVLWARVEKTGEYVGRDSVLRVRALDGGERTIDVPGYVRSCAASPDGELLAVAVSDGLAGHIEMRSMRTSALLWRGEHAPTSTYDLGRGRGQEGFAPEIRDCAFGPDGAFLVTAALDSTLRLWEPSSGSSFRSLSEPSGFLEKRSPFRQTQTPVWQKTACAVTPDGEAILSGSHGGALALWEVGTGTAVATLEGHGDEVTACAVASDGSFAMSASRDGTVRIWDMDIAAQGG